MKRSCGGWSNSLRYDQRCKAWAVTSSPEEPTAWAQDPNNLCDSLTPVVHVVDYGEVEDRIEGLWRVRQVRRVADLNSHPVTEALEACFRPGHHGRVSVHGDNPGSTEVVKDELGTDTAAAAELEDVRTDDPSTASPQQRSLVPPLQRSTRRAVDQHRFGAVHQHVCAHLLVPARPARLAHTSTGLPQAQHTSPPADAIVLERSFLQQ